MIPIVIESDGRIERSYDIYSRLLKDRIVIIAQPIDDHLANDRCRHENEIEQLKNGVHAMKLPASDLESNWAYMVIAALAWNLKAWVAQWMPDRKEGERMLRMEFKTFLNALIRITCQIVRTGRRLVYRFLGYTPWLENFFETWEVIRGLRET